MNRRFAMLTLSGVGVLLPLAVGCADHDHYRHARRERVVREEVVYAEPPPPVQEVVTVSPGPEYVWIEGHHVWRANRYEWAPGRWDRRPRAAAVYERGRWERRGRGYVWVDGRWR